LSFARLASSVAQAAGSPYAFLAAVLVVILWAISGPFLGYSDYWQLTINTGTTIVTFLMVFLIQSSQNHDTNAIQLKLDELIRANENARDFFRGIERRAQG